MARRVLAALLPAGRLWLGEGLPQRLRGVWPEGVELSEHVGGGDALVDLAVVEVGACGPRGRCDAHAGVRASRVWGMSGSVAPFGEKALDGERLERLFTPRAMLAFEEDRWRVLEVPSGISARDVQEGAPFPLVAGPDLGPLRIP